MNQEKNFWRRLWERTVKYVSVEPEPDKPYETDAIVAPDFPLFARLQRQAADPHSSVWQLKLEDVKKDELIHRMIALMFGLQPGPKSFDNWLLAALRARESLQEPRSIFYLYISDEIEDAPSKEEIEERFCQLLIEMHQRPGAPDSLTGFIERRFEEEGRLDDPAYQFQNTLDHLSKFLKGFLGLQISICFKPFPQSQQAVTFLTVRNSIHNRRAILRRERDLKLNAQSPQADPYAQSPQADPHVNLAIELTADAGEKSVRLNAHFFSPRARWPLSQESLLLGDWRDRWRLSIGIADHDEVICEDLKDVVYTLDIDNIRIERGAWEFPPPRFRPGLPEWMNVTLERWPTLDASLLDKLSRVPFNPLVTLIARALFNEEERMCDLLIAERPDFRKIIEGLQIVSAIEVQPNRIWLARAGDGKVYKLEPQLNPRPEPLDHNQPFNFTQPDNTTITYTWRSAQAGESAPPQICGLLLIEPSMVDRHKFVSRPGYSPGTSFSIGYNTGDIFPPGINHDATLGKRGVVELVSVRSEDDRVTYALKPVSPQATNPYFALKPDRADEFSDGWFVYTKREDAELDPRTERALHNDNEVKIVGASNRLICGTSVFEIKTSGTPNLAMLRAVRAGQGGTVTPIVPATRGDLGETTILMRLEKTQWKDYELIQISDSQVAFHYRLSNKQPDDARFLKVYRATSASNAIRERNFYAEFRQESDRLYITPPEHTLQGTDDQAPWALVFPMLNPLKSRSLAQTTAIGYGVAVLLKAMSAKNRINYDLDKSALCETRSGRLSIVDFDNVFPVFTESLATRDSEMVQEILDAHELPTKHVLLPPEAVEFKNATNDFQRDQALRKITDRFGVYLLAVTLLSLHDLNRWSDAQGAVVNEQDIIKLAESEGASDAAARKLAILLGEMLASRAEDRPEPDQLVLRLGLIALQFANLGKTARDQVMRVLGDQLLDDLGRRRDDLERLRDERALTEREEKDLAELTEHLPKVKDDKTLQQPGKEE